MTLEPLAQRSVKGWPEHIAGKGNYLHVASVAYSFLEGGCSHNVMGGLLFWYKLCWGNFLNVREEQCYSAGRMRRCGMKSQWKLKLALRSCDTFVHISVLVLYDICIDCIIENC